MTDLTLSQSYSKTKQQLNAIHINWVHIQKAVTTNKCCNCFVARDRIELSTSWLWIMRSNHLSYRAIIGLRVLLFLVCECKGTTFFITTKYYKAFFQKYFLQIITINTLNYWFSIKYTKIENVIKKSVTILFCDDKRISWAIFACIFRHFGNLSEGA